MKLVELESRSEIWNLAELKENEMKAVRPKIGPRKS